MAQQIDMQLLLKFPKEVGWVRILNRKNSYHFTMILILVVKKLAFTDWLSVLIIFWEIYEIFADYNYYIIHKIKKSD